MGHTSINLVTVISSPVHEPFDKHEHDHVEEEEHQEDNLGNEFAYNAESIFEVPETSIIV